MKQKINYVVVLLAASPFFTAVCQQAESISEIRGVNISGKILIEVERKTEYALSIKYGDADSACLNKTIENGILMLELAGGSKCKGEITARLSCPQLTSVTLSSRADLTSANVLTGDSLMLDVRGNAKAYIDMDVKYLKANLSTGGMYQGEGYALTQHIGVSTSSIFSGLSLEGETVTAEVSSSGIIKVYATKKLDASAAAGGYIGYAGEPANKKLDPGANGKIEKLEQQP
jgi:hypothetical protein